MCVLRQYQPLPLGADTELPLLSTPKHTLLVNVHCGVNPENLTGHYFDLLFTELEVFFVGSRFWVPTKILDPTL